MSTRFRSILAGLTGMLIASSAQGVAQDLPPSGVYYRPGSVAENLAELEREAIAHRQEPGSGVLWYKSHQSEVSDATIDSVLMGLETLSLDHPNPEVRSSAAAHLSTLSTTIQSPPLPGALARALFVYERSKDDAIRSLIVSTLRRSGDDPRAVAFLRRIAQQSPEDQDYPGAAADAFYTLYKMGPRGNAAARGLVQKNLLRDPRARRIAGQTTPASDPASPEDPGVMDCPPEGSRGARNPAQPALPAGPTRHGRAASED